MIIVMMMMISISDELPPRDSVSGEWLAGTPYVTSMEGDDVNMSCIFRGRCVFNFSF